MQHWTPESGVVCKAGYLAAAALTQQALADGPVAFQPLSGTGAAQFDSYWVSVKAFLTKPGETAVTGGFQHAIVQERVTGLQSAISNTATERAKQRLFSKYEDRVTAPGRNTVLAEEHLAGLHSMQQGVGTAWTNAVPTKPTWELSNSSFIPKYSPTASPATTRSTENWAEQLPNQGEAA